MSVPRCCSQESGVSTSNGSDTEPDCIPLCGDISSKEYTSHQSL